MIYLYVKQHRITGLKYFGKTEKEPFLYNGFGKYWQRHLKVHGYDVETINIWSFENQVEATSFAIGFSKEYDIVKSKFWANMRVENALDGNPIGLVQSKESSEKKAAALRGRKRSPCSEERKRKISLALTDMKRKCHSEETKHKIAKALIGNKNGLHITKEGRKALSEKLSGRTFSEETRQRMSIAAKNREAAKKEK